MAKLVILGESTIWLTAPFPHGKRTRKKIFQEAAKVSQDRKRKGQSSYLQVELAMLYWVRQMQSRVQPPPLTYCILKMKTKQYVISLLFSVCM